MLRNLDELKTSEADRISLEVAINTVKSYRNLTLAGFVDYLRGVNHESNWTVNKLNKILDGSMPFKKQDRRDILEAIRLLNPEGHIYKQTILDLLGIKFFEQLSLFILVIATLFMGVLK